MLARGPDRRRSKVIDIASIDGISLNPQETCSYRPSKAAMIHLTRTSAVRLISDGIVVSGIAPGAFASRMNRLARDHADETAARIPARRIGRPQDMAAAAVYLASEAGDHVVGGDARRGRRGHARPLSGAARRGAGGAPAAGHPDTEQPPPGWGRGCSATVGRAATAG